MCKVTFKWMTSICTEAQIFIKQSSLRPEQHRTWRANDNPNRNIVPSSDQRSHEALGGHSRTCELCSAHRHPHHHAAMITCCKHKGLHPRHVALLSLNIFFPDTWCLECGFVIDDFKMHLLLFYIYECFAHMPTSDYLVPTEGRWGYYVPWN